jgi:hypothetical protein
MHYHLLQGEVQKVKEQHQDVAALLYHKYVHSWFNKSRGFHVIKYTVVTLSPFAEGRGGMQMWSS